MPLQQFLKFITVALLVLGLSFIAGALITGQLFPERLPRISLGLKSGEQEKALQGKRVNILIMGNDARPGEGITRSDSLVLASIDPGLKKAVFLFIPRDTLWVSPRHGRQKINAALALEGPEGAVTAVKDLLGIPIDHYAVFNFDAFIKLIDALGGVEIDVEQPMYKSSEGIYIEKGRQVLNGKDALGYVRYRDYLMGDVDRDRHQEAFIKALASRILSPAVVGSLPELVVEFNNLLVTDMLATEMLEYAAWAPAFSSDSIITQTMPGYFENGYDESGNLVSCYWIVSEQEAHSMVDDLYAGRNFEVY